MKYGENLFGRRDPRDARTLPTTPPAANHPSASPALVPTNPRPGVPLPAANAAPGAAPADAAPRTEESPGSKLIVGPNIKLKGVEITDCDTLVVEGLVEATMDSRVMQIAEQGAFKGSAEIDIAEIRGLFDGNLTVREKLVIHSTGKVTGKIRYGKIVVEEGGQLSGEISFGTSASSGSAAKPASATLQAAA